MDFEFNPTFALLAKFVIGLPPTSKSEAEVLAVAKYLGVSLPASSLIGRIKILTEELNKQNSYLNAELSSESIFNSEEYRTSMFIREVVSNNRINLQNRLKRDR